MKSLLISISIVAIAGLVVGAMAVATDTVTCTVTPGAYAVSVSPTSDPYGPMTLSGTKTGTTITATNSGSIPERLNILGSDAVYGTTECGGNPCTWTLSTSALGQDQFVHAFTTKATPPTSGATLGSDPTTQWVPLDKGTSYTQLVASVAAAGTQDFHLDMRTPSSAGTNTSYGHAYSITVTLQAVAP